jgi:uncharacterized membrane protein YphA (DoxX/SURF4 family)
MISPIPTVARHHVLASRLHRAIRWCCLLLLCSAYLQGGLVKAFDFPAALAEMEHFGLAPARPLAVLTIAGELGAALLVLTGIQRWAGALYLAVFTLAANLVANRFWELAGVARTMSENGFFEHLGLAGAFMLVAWIDLCDKPSMFTRAAVAAPSAARQSRRSGGGT